MKCSLKHRQLYHTKLYSLLHIRGMPCITDNKVHDMELDLRRRRACTQSKSIKLIAYIGDRRICTLIVVLNGDVSIGDRCKPMLTAHLCMESKLRFEDCRRFTYRSLRCALACRCLGHRRNSRADHRHGADSTSAIRLHTADSMQVRGQ